MLYLYKIEFTVVGRKTKTKTHASSLLSIIGAYHGLPSVFDSLFYLIASVVLFEALSAGTRTYAIKVRQMYYYIRVFDNKLTLVLINTLTLLIFS
jgi:hypothetical protein